MQYHNNDFDYDFVQNHNNTFQCYKLSIITIENKTIDYINK